MKQIHNHFIVKIFSTLILCGFSVLVSGQSTADGSMPQYFFSQFGTSVIRMKNGQSQTQVMNYNTVTEKMVFTKGEKFYDLTNPEMVDTITIEGCKFVPVGRSFYQVLYAGKTNLYMQHISSLLPPGKPVGFGGTSRLSSSVYVSNVKLEGGQYNLKLPADYTVVPNPVYWIRTGNEWSDFTTEKQLLKLFPEKAGVIREKIKSDKVKLDKPESLVRLMEFVNSL
jgi:hypothetical protein